MRLLESSGLGVANWADDFIGMDENVVVEMTMASVRSYKRFRVESSPLGIARLYADIALPHYVCVFELFKVSDYLRPEGERNAFGELVLDATACATVEPWNAVLLMRYPGIFYYRLPDGDEWFVYTDKVECSTFPAYDACLCSCEPYESAPSREN